MKSVHIRDIPDQTLLALKRLARSHRRSLQGELRDILERAARQAPPEEQEHDIDLVTVDTGRTEPWRREEIYGDSGR